MLSQHHLQASLLEQLPPYSPQSKDNHIAVSELEKLRFSLFVILCCESQVKSSANKWFQAGPLKKTRGRLVIVASTQNSGFQQTFYTALKGSLSLFFISCYTSGQAKSFIPCFNPSLYFRKTQNQVPRSALVAKSERAASFGAELWIALENWFLWIGEGGKTFNRIRGRFCSRNLLSKQVEMAPPQLYK